jgi:hypothetical protein
MILDNILKFLINPKTEIVVCGDITLNYLINSNRKYQLNALLNSYNLIDAVDFPTRTQHTSASIINNIFIDYSRIDNYSTFPCYNGISDHDSQLITIYNVNNLESISDLHIIRKVNQTSLIDFNFKLSFELREDIFEGNDIHKTLTVFKSISKTFL